MSQRHWHLSSHHDFFLTPLLFFLLFLNVLAVRSRASKRLLDTRGNSYVSFFFNVTGLFSRYIELISYSIFIRFRLAFSLNSRICSRSFQSIDGRGLSWILWLLLKFLTHGRSKAVIMGL